MTQEPETLVLELLHAMRSDLSDIRHDIDEMKAQLIGMCQLTSLRLLRPPDDECRL